MAAGYRIQFSNRAKHPRLKMSARHGLVVVVPGGFDTARIPSVLAAKSDWIRRSEERLREQIKFLAPEPDGTPPQRIPLRAVGQEWAVNYRQTAAPKVTAVERQGQQLLVYGNLAEIEPIAGALRRWLGRKTREHVVPWLNSLANKRGLEVPRVTIRAQRTRWGSCSPTGTISLNVRLLFLQQHLVRYALLHELTHLQEMNHSRRYWVLLGTFEPNYLALDRELRAGWRLVPSWIRPRP